MPSFSKRSLEKLGTCSQDLQNICYEVIKHFDFSVVCGHRNKADQDAAFKAGNSKLQFPNSKHNSYPSKAIDIIPYPVDYKDERAFYYLAGLMKMVAIAQGKRLRWGGDWNGDNNFKDNKFNDLGHFELED